MQLRNESLFDDALVRFLIDPMLSGSAVRSRLRSNLNSNSKLIPFVLRHFIDPTILPPPSYTRARADQVYGPAFQRCIEFVARSRLEGDVLEFGTFLGYTARWLASLIKAEGLSARLYLFDSFEGLPDITSEIDRDSYEVAASGVWHRGAMKVDPQIHERIGARMAHILGPDKLSVVKGYFENTLPAALPSRPAAVVHLDCDLYMSARFVLDTLISRDLLQDGTVLILDDFNCNRANPGMGERRACLESFAAQSRFTLSPWFSYGWHGQVCFVHDSRSQG